MDADVIHASRMRPTYEWHSPEAPEAFVARLAEIARADPHVDVQIGARHLLLSIPVAARRTWSPALDLQANNEGEGSFLFGRMGPHPNVWAAFLTLHALNGCVGVMGLVWGLSQWTRGELAWGLASIPLFFVTGGLLHLGSIVGRGLGADEVHRLLAVVERGLAAEGARPAGGGDAAAPTP